HCGEVPARLMEEDCRSGQVEATGGLIINDLASVLIDGWGTSHLHRTVRRQIHGMQAIYLGDDIWVVVSDVSPHRLQLQSYDPLQQLRRQLELLLPPAVSDSASQ